MDESETPQAQNKPCPECEMPMEATNTGYAFQWTCEEDSCGYADCHTTIYDWDAFAQIKTVQKSVGQDAAERLAAELKDGVLA